MAVSAATKRPAFTTARIEAMVLTATKAKFPKLDKKISLDADLQGRDIAADSLDIGEIEQMAYTQLANEGAIPESTTIVKTRPITPKTIADYIVGDLRKSKYEVS